MGCFGRSGGSSQDSNSTSQTMNLSPEQKKYFDKALKLYGEELGKNDNVWPGDRVADFTDLQRGVLESAPSFMSVFDTPKSTGTPLFGETGTAVKDLLGGNVGAEKITDQQTESYFTDKIKEPTMQMLKDDLLPTIDESYAGGNFFGSARGKARDKMTTDVADTLTRQRADLNWDVTQSNQAIDEAKAGRSLSALDPAMRYGAVPAQEVLNNLRIAAGQLGGMSDLFGLGATEQTQEQKEIESQMVKFAQENQITDPQNLQVLLSLLRLPVYSTTENIGHMNQYQNSWKSGDWGSNVFGPLMTMGASGLLF